MNMGPRNLLILFFSAVAVSLVILIILSSLVFKNLSLDFNTHLPETTPDIGPQFSNQTQSMNPDSKADNVSRATVNVPPESVEPAATTSDKTEGKPGQGAGNTPPMTDDAVLENNVPLPPMNDAVETDDNLTPPTAPKTTPEKSVKGNATAPRSSRTERKPDQPMAPVYAPDTSGGSDSDQSSGPPVPGQ